MHVNLTMRCVRVTMFAEKKAISITYFECVSVGLVIQHLRYIVIHVLSGFAVFFHIISYKTRFSKKKKKVIEYKMCVLIFATTFV